MLTTSDIVFEIVLNQFLGAWNDFLRKRADVVLSYHFSDHVLSIHSC